MHVRERIGDAIGVLLAPAIAAVSRFRRARTFHPRGLTFIGRSEPIIGGAFANLGADLEGQILARCSGALWKRPNEHFDVLGIALRFRRIARPFDARALPGDRDLLFATIRSPFTMVFSPFTTNAHDFMQNRFFAVAPFAVHNRDRVELRLVPVDPRPREGTRGDKLVSAVEEGACVWHLEARRTLTRQWHAVARISFDEPIAVDQEALRFDAFRTDDKLQPVGVVHAIRRAVYSTGQGARPTHA
jgi:N-acetylglutamate synthase-like GNAT family acetyltransferase